MAHLVLPLGLSSRPGPPCATAVGPGHRAKEQVGTRLPHSGARRCSASSRAECLPSDRSGCSTSDRRCSDCLGVLAFGRSGENQQLAGWGVVVSEVWMQEVLVTCFLGFILVYIGFEARVAPEVWLVGYVLLIKAWQWNAP